MFKKPQNTSNSIAITKNTNLYLTIILFVIVIICVCLKIRGESNAFSHYLSVISGYSSIIIGAILAKLLISVANRRVKYTKSVDLPIAQNRTLD
jgi:predicted membrane protein